ncbi:MAG: beta-ketoacyl synthase N-terminal-like domain-containing protein, partial [Thermoanaerobaculia bacterium]|nr:beta-ketoacyl synthase N-terminal-like domain-containing protein [Thermoanaerobaculia bacterium]
MSSRVAVTGLGLVSCLGHSYAEAIERLRRGESGIIAVPHWQQWGIKSLVAGKIRDLEEKQAQAGLPKRLVPGMSSAALYCSIAAVDAVADAGLDEESLQAASTACIVGCGTGSVRSVYKAADLAYSGKIRRVDPFTVLRCMASSPSAAVSNLLGVHGPSYSI